MIKGSKAGKPPAESESESLLSQEEQTLYSPVDIKKFLQGTKGTRLLKVEDHFSDLKLFIESAKPLTKTSGDVETEANTKLEAQLTPQELYAALMSLKSGKAPGIDGLPVDFYKSFWSVLGEDLLEVFNDCLERGRLPLSCRRAVITLLPKKGDLQELKNWRPVSLLCTDYKIMSKVLASRLREVMASIIHPDQTYCVPGRLISDNVTLIRDILEVSGSLAVDTGLISIDQEKAFDRVEHKYLWQTLAAFGFSPGFIAKIRVLYCDIAECAENKWRGRVLILNNLISTALWHRLACVDPPVSPLSRIQAVLVDFFWDRLHWVPQSILFLPKEEGGQGLVHLASRGAAFRLTVLTETPHRTCRPGLEAFILLHLAEVWWSETGSGSVPDGLQESGHFISASVLQKCFLSVDFTEEAEEGTGRLSVLALTGTGQAKMAVYLSRRRKVEEDVNIDVVPVFVNMVKSRLLIEFNFYRAAQDLQSFQQMWGYEGALCSVSEGNLVFGHELV
ncbi:hypothetical protein L3Q82_005602 [Scortum barcoo]|uniref:Uncharacterized protein n=1 Tax=Scortum barcoo TaxID=214431 RepID=A0ACB8V6A9_9TELE|nr:hypothetical protein L3Q82_005602 [Scortum barcoo]